MRAGTLGAGGPAVTKELLHRQVGNARLVELRAHCFVAQPLVEGHGLELGVQHDDGRPHAPSRRLERVHQRAPRTAAAQLREHRDAFRLGVAVDDAQTGRAHRFAVDPGEEMGAGAVEPVQLEGLGHPLTLHEDRSPNRKADLEVRPTGLLDHDGAHGGMILAAGQPLCETRAPMNFFAHATLAAARSPEPAYVLGAMLPDLAAMAGDRLAGVDDGELAAGVAFHHESDAAFHATPEFVARCTHGRRALERAGVGRGAARAVAHVGTELLLDGWIAHAQGISPHYRRALALGPELGGRLCWRRGEGAGHWPRLCRRLLASPVPASYDDPAFVCARLVRILSRRPRLALAPSEEPAVRRWLREARAELRTSGAALLAAAAGTA